MRSNNTMESEQYVCALMRNSVAHKFCVHSLDKNDTKVLRLGSLCKVVTLSSVNIKPPDNFLPIKEMQLDNLHDTIDNNIWLVPKDDVVRIPPTLVQAFSAISLLSHRVDLATNSYLCKELAKVKVGSRVYLCPEAEIFQQQSEQWEPATVRYVGPIPELGSASHFYGLVLSPESTQGDGDGSFCNRRYFHCDSGCKGTFVSINRLRLRPNESLQNSNSFMQTNKNNNESAKTNFRSTLVLQLKDQKNIPKAEQIQVEAAKPMSKTSLLSRVRSEKLIDVESADECPLKIGDRVVWMRDESGAELGTVRWTGILHEQRAQQYRVGVEFDNPIGTGCGMYKGIQYFASKLRHSSFLPIDSLLRAEDFFGKPEDHAQTKSGNSNERSTSASQLSHPATSKTDALTKTRQSEPPSWTHSRAVVQLPDYQYKHSSTRDAQTGDVNSRSDSNYIFPDTLSNVNSTKGKLDNASKRVAKESRKSESSLESYPIGEAPIKDYVLRGNSVRTVAEIPAARKNQLELKIRHSYSRDKISVDKTDFLDIWNSASGESNPKPSTKEKQRIASTAQLNINDPIGFEAVGLGGPIHAGNSVGRVNEWRENTQLSSNLSESSDGSDPEIEPLDLGVGSVVEVLVRDQPRYGVIRWIGIVPEDIKCRRVAGIEMEEELLGCSDGTFNTRRYFHCNPKRALFVGVSQCKKDGRFQESIINHADNKTKLFGPEDCPVIPGAVRPCTISRQEDMDTICGKYKGIQGHHNSCYLDATLFSMFAFSSAFDSLLFRPCGPYDTDKYEEVQRVLREEIVNPLRKNQFCRWDRVMKLRTLLENHSSVTGLTSEEKDPEEFLTSLVAQMLKAKPFLKLSSGQDAYHYQLFIEKDEQLRSPTVQQLFEQSFLSSDIKLKEVPSCLIIQMPRFGKSYKMYPRIFPSPLLDVTDIIEDSPRQCTVCGKLAEFECKECFGKNGIESNTLESISYCSKCLDTAHTHKLRNAHKFRKLTVPMEFSILQDHCQIPRLYMHLFAVVCIETSHYVSFVKCGSLPDSPWCFFDSMADRKGEQNGYNIPEVVSCPDIPYWLSDEGVRDLSEFKDDRKLPEHAKRLLCDAYMCMYQSTDMIMYK